jgi:biopolymer transport protein ExbD
MSVERRRMRRVQHDEVGMQIAPMIDVCFLLLFFYILTSKPMNPEADMSMTLPGTVLQEESLEIPDEQRISILEDGQVLLNEQRMDDPQSLDLPTLLRTLMRFKETTDANKSEALIIVDAVDDSHHQRIVDVLNVCARAGIRGVTFAASEEE